MSFYTKLIRPVLFRFDAEKIHHFVFTTLKLLFLIPGIKFLYRFLFVQKNEKLRRNIFGIDFPNPIGLAAGFDKNASLFEELSCLGFGFIEIGTVTPLAQAGNDKPRMFRLQSDSAIINRMGFNNDGVEEIVANLKKRKSKIIIGGNIGKNKNTPNENAINDYEICFKALYNHVDYFVVNVSSPNTPGLRALQEKEPLLKILNRLQELNIELAGSFGKIRRPVLLKIAPDLTQEQLDEIIDVVVSSKLDGIIATNTTISREGLRMPQDQLQQIGTGGLSGKPLTARSTEVIRYLATKAEGRYKVIGAGGIHSAEDALEKLNAGADLIQLYTGFVYEGPGLIKNINRELLRQK